jgi:hypothetical protein
MVRPVFTHRTIRHRPRTFVPSTQPSSCIYSTYIHYMFQTYSQVIHRSIKQWRKYIQNRNVDIQLFYGSGTSCSFYKSTSQTINYYVHINWYKQPYGNDELTKFAVYESTVFYSWYFRSIILLSYLYWNAWHLFLVMFTHGINLCGDINNFIFILHCIILHGLLHG